MSYDSQNNFSCFSRQKQDRQSAPEIAPTAGTPRRFAQILPSQCMSILTIRRLFLHCLLGLRFRVIKLGDPVQFTDDSK
jgi:hypothetical protein